MDYELSSDAYKEFPRIQTERLSLRAFEEEDALDLFGIRSNDTVMKYMDMTPMQSMDEAEGMISGILDDYKNRRGINWVICEHNSNQMIGYVAFWNITEKNLRAELGYALRPAFWRQGIAREALQAIITFGFEDLKLHSIEANVNPSNIPSIILLKKLGFVREAYFRENYLFNGKFLDSVIYSLLESD